MITVEQALDIVLNTLSKKKVEKKSLSDACGYTLAQDVFAAVDIPNFLQSSMDGYAFKYDPLKTSYKLYGESAAGSGSNFLITETQAARIFTGAPLPEGADTVVMQEKTSREDDLIIFDPAAIHPHMHTRAKGSEIRAGEMAMIAGLPVTPAATGFLAGIGIKEVFVYSAPVVTIILTGNELTDPGLPLEFGQVYESNSYALSAALKNAGIKKINILRARDTKEDLLETLNKARQDSDWILFTGGVSAGDYDFVPSVVESAGFKKHFHKIKQKPGKPMFFASNEQNIVFGLPGNPSSVLTCFYEYLLPALDHVMSREASLTRTKARLQKSFSKPAGLTHFVKGKFANEEVMPLHAQESYRMSSFAISNCLIRLPEAGENFLEGEIVEVHLLRN